MSLQQQQESARNLALEAMSKPQIYDQRDPRAQGLVQEYARLTNQMGGLQGALGQNLNWNGILTTTPVLGAQTFCASNLGVGHGG